MSAHIPRTLLNTALAVAALTIFHSARPLAVSAQTRATLSVSATVVNADAAWKGHELALKVIQTEAESRSTTSAALQAAGLSGHQTTPETFVVRSERAGTVVWVGPATADHRPTLVTVAHLGS